jgi:hypothetical protein
VPVGREADQPQQDHSSGQAEVQQVVGVVDGREVGVAVAVDEEALGRHGRVGDAASEQEDQRPGPPNGGQDPDPEGQVDEIVDHADSEQPEQSRIGVGAEHSSWS